MKANLIRMEGNSYRKRYVYACTKCGTEFWRLQCNDRINPLCGKCKTEVDRQRNKELAEIRQAKHDAEIRDKAIDEFVKECEEFEDLSFDTYQIKRIKMIAEELRKQSN